MNITRKYRLLEKLAVSLAQLRIANRSIAPDKLVRRTIAPPVPGAMPGPASIVKKYHPQQAEFDKKLWGPLAGFRKQMAEAVPASFKGKMFIKGDTAKAIRAQGGTVPTTKDPQAKEFFNRAVHSHEAAELGKHFGPGQYGTHLSTRPLFHDLNIAATATGPGSSGVKTMLRGLRRKELEGLERYIPGISRLRLGEERISRHAMKRLQQRYAANLLAENEKFMSSLG